jgi:uncharacterized protein involved in exopolysaccharide biosynthesis
MKIGEMLRILRDAARREWWLVAVVVVAAVAAAALVGGRAQTTYTAQSTFLSQGVPLPDDVVRDVGAKAIAASSSVSVAEAGKVRMSSFGNPLNRLLVTYAGPTREDALVVIQAADQAVLDYVAGRNQILRTSYENSVEVASASMTAIKPLLMNRSLTASERAAIEFELWQIQQTSIQSSGSATVLIRAYQLQGAPSVAATSKSSALVTRMVLGGFAGLIVGLMLAGVREALRRRTPAPAA